MFKIPKQEYAVEFKELAVKRAKSGETVGAVARDLGLVEQTLRNWVKAAKAGKLHAPGAKTVTPNLVECGRPQSLRTDMPNIGSILKEEIIRLSRKECRSQVEPTKKATIWQRHEVAGLKRQVAQLARQVALLSRKTLGASAVVPADDGGKPARFSAKGLRVQRERL